MVVLRSLGFPVVRLREMGTPRLRVAEGWRMIGVIAVSPTTGLDDEMRRLV